jgi:uncharacterized RDD family membrane protein YckC
MWYYTENGEQRGPVTETDFDALVQAGKIDAETLVWREGQGDWQPYRVARPGPAGAIPVAPAFPGAATVVCAECGQKFPPGEVMQFSGVSVCAACKPIFVQKLREGAHVGGGMVYASFGLRFGAYFLDGIITGVAGALIGAVVGGIMGAAMAGQGATAAALVIPLVAGGLGILLRLAYFTFFIGKYGATPGKMACKIKVVNADGSPVSYAKAAGRFLGYIVSSITLGIGFLMMLWDGEKRTLHDRMCDTRVIKN